MDGDPTERWPGYNEQSWQERFQELERRYDQLVEAVARWKPVRASQVQS